MELRARKTALALPIQIIFLYLLQTNPSAHQPPLNVILVLADDLGYGDLGFEPFNSNLMKNVNTPHLAAMAKSGLMLTNFHTASPVCSPARASIMVGLFPWRLGLDFIYAGDLKNDGTEEMDHEQLPLLPNIAMSFRDAGYYTAHIGKWHLGGQNVHEIKARVDSNFTNCNVPGINQYGFHEYVGMSEGTGSARYWTHQNRATYASGARHLLRNDVALTPKDSPEVLTDRQTDEAIRVVRQQTELRRPFFLNLWYDAPHSPWEPIEPFFSRYSHLFDNERLQKYASMISNMDMNIGRLLESLQSLGIARNTIVFFTSDNGPENDSGSGGRFKGCKRLLTEGGIRVPAIVAWPGVVQADVTSNHFTMTTDIYPTLLDAAGINMPPHIRIDGFSMLPVLLSDHKKQLLIPFSQSVGQSKSASSRTVTDSRKLNQRKSVFRYGDERVVYFYTHSIGFPKLTSIQAYGYKLLWNDYEGRERKSTRLPPSYRLFDMRIDETEDRNLLPALLRDCPRNNQTSPPSSPNISDNTLDDYLNIIPTFEEINRIPRGLDKTSHVDRIKLLKLVSHLHIIEHMFRFQGDFEWLLYHLNKPHITSNTCSIRTINSSSWIDFNFYPIISPRYCGETFFTENRQHSDRKNSVELQQCDCYFHNSKIIHQRSSMPSCVNIWHSSESTSSSNSVLAKNSRDGWKLGPILNHLLNFGQASDGIIDRMKTILRQTKFKPICDSDTQWYSNPSSLLSADYAAVGNPMRPRSHKDETTFSVATDDALPSQIPEIKYNLILLDYCHYGIDVNTIPVNNGWASESIYNHNFPQLKGTKTLNDYADVSLTYHHKCYQRLRIKSFELPSQTFSVTFHVSSNACGTDSPIESINHLGMDHPLHICPQSLFKLSASDPSIRSTFSYLQAYQIFRSPYKLVQRSGYMDDNIMMGVINDLVYNEFWYYHTTANGDRNKIHRQDKGNDPASLSGSNQKLDRIRRRNKRRDINSNLTAVNPTVAVIDTLFYHLLQINLDSCDVMDIYRGNISSVLTTNSKIISTLDKIWLTLSKKDKMDFENETVNKLLRFMPSISSFLRPYTSRVIDQHNKLEAVLIPVLSHGAWSVIILYGDLKLANLTISGQKYRVYSTYYSSVPGGSSKLSPRLLIHSLLTHIYGAEYTNFLRWEHTDSSNDNETIRGMHWDDAHALSGPKVIIFIRAFLASLQKLKFKFERSHHSTVDFNQLQKALISKISTQEALFEIQLWREHFLLESQRQSNRWKNYFTSMSSIKF